MTERKPDRHPGHARSVASLLLVCALFLGGAIPAVAVDRSAAHEMNARLGRGINMGNMFEAPSEAAWGNPWRSGYFRMIADLGFDHVRIPVRWETAARSLATAPYTITASFMSRVREVVDEAMGEGLLVVLNMHHHDALYADPRGQRDRFLAQWRQIAAAFADYPEELVFEVLNEPHGNLSATMWNDFFADALLEIRRTNPTRVVLLGSAEYGGLGAVPRLRPPADPNLILSVHYYNPFSFTHQGADWVGSQSNAWLGTTWNDTEAERESIESEFRVTRAFAARHDLPIHVGEFGAYSTADLESRVRWTRFLARWFEEQGWSWAYWEFSAGFGIYSPSRRAYVQELVDALLHDPMSEPIAVDAAEVYRSDYARGTDGWTLGTQGGATARLSGGGSALTVAIQRGGSETWHVQLVRSGIPIERDRTYRVRFVGTAPAERSATAYIGRASAPWDAYSGYTAVAFSPDRSEQTFTFTMGAVTDPRARLVFDLGLSTVDVTIESVVIEEIRAR